MDIALKEYHLMMGESARRIGSKSDLPAKGYANLETFVESLPDTDIRLVLKSF